MKELLRRNLRSSVDVLLRARSHRYKFLASSRCLVVAPHPDDETLGCGGLIATRRMAQLPVNILYLTDGAKSHVGHPHIAPEQMSKIRSNEVLFAMRHLEVATPSLRFMNLPDGSLADLCAQDAEKFAHQLASAIATVAPTEIFLPAQDDGSSEHEGAFKLIVRALEIAGLKPRLFEYPVWARWSPQRLLRSALSRARVWRLSFPEAVNLKRAAIACYVSQVKPTPPWPQSVLPPGFTNCFSSPEEFFFERSP